MLKVNRAVPDISTIPDIQNSKDTRHISIDKVGIKDIKHLKFIFFFIIM